MNINPLFLVDGYKLGHHSQYPVGMTNLFSNYTARTNRHFKSIAVPGFVDDYIVVFGTSAVVKYIHRQWDEHFFNKPAEQVIGQFARVVRIFLNDPTFSVEHIKQLHELGQLPVAFNSLKEGTLCKIGVPFFTITNTVEGFGWFVNYLETQISCLLWKPVTAATIARHYKKVLAAAYDRTCDSRDGMDFMVHDFSMRGLGSPEDAAISGMGHLTAFSGSDNIPAIYGVSEWYGFDIEHNFLAGGVPATEHSVTSSNIRSIAEESGVDDLAAETLAIARLLDMYPTGYLSYVSDTYDYFGVITDVLKTLKPQLLARDGKFVVRPDSGDPADIVCGSVTVVSKEEAFAAGNTLDDVAESIAVQLYIQVADETPHGECGPNDVFQLFKYNNTVYKLTVEIEWNRYDKQYYYTDGYQIASVEEYTLTPEEKGTLNLLWETFGGTVNSKGYRVLDSHIGIIYGDSITPKVMHDILTRMEAMGFAASNVVFGAGSYTYQHITRDTLGMAMKATWCRVNGKDVKLFKDPKTGDGTKKSAKGLFVVVDGQLHDNLTEDEWLHMRSEDQLAEIRPDDHVDFMAIRQLVNESI